MEAVTARERREMERREHLYRGERPPLDVGGRTVILVDDGVATGSSMRAAVLALRQRRTGRIVVAVPVGPPETCTALQEEADEVICANSPVDFDAVGQSYDNFSQTTDAEVKELLERAAADHVSTAAFG
jgi:predicted phosphoribosyltransferase